jgi:hypothetical protein
MGDCRILYLSAKVGVSVKNKHIVLQSVVSLMLADASLWCCTVRIR